MRMKAAVIVSMLWLGCADTLMVPDPDGEPPPAPGPAPTRQVAGLYRVESTLDLQLDPMSDAASAFRAFDDLTNGPYDPATWLIDYALREIDSDVITTVVSAFRPSLDRDVNGVIRAAAPTLLDDLVTMGRNLGDASRAFGIGSELLVERDPRGADSAFVLRHTLKSVFFTFQGQRRDFPLATTLLLPEPVAIAIPGSIDDRQGFVIGRHSFSLPSGALFLALLDHAVIPALEPAATSLSDFLRRRIDCVVVGQRISTSVGVGSASFWANGCRGGLERVANVIENQILQLDGSSTALEWQGRAMLVDRDGNHVIDALDAGRWTGTYKFAKSISMLPDSPANAFHATRIGPSNR